MVISFNDANYRQLVKLSRIILKGERGSHTKNRRIRKKKAQKALNIIISDMIWDYSNWESFLKKMED